MIDNLSSEQLLNLATVLDEIRRLSFYAKEGDVSVYPSDEDLNAPLTPYSLLSEQKRFYVFLIQDEEALSIVQEYTYGKREVPYRWALKVNRNNLKQLIQKTEELILSKSKAVSFTVKKEEIVVPSQEIPLTNFDLIESLKRRIDGFINLPEKGFFLGIADYVKFISENSGFQSIISTIEAFKSKDGAKLEELGEKLLEDVARVEKIVFERIKKENIKSDIVSERIVQYEMTKDGRMQSGAPKAEAFHDGIALVISSLHESGYTMLVENYLTFSEGSTSISNFNISKNYYPFKQELAEFKSKYEKTIWGSWDELVLVYLVIHKYQEHIQKFKNENDVVGEMNFYALHGEMANVLGNVDNDSSRFQFIKDDYVIHINRVHDFIINKLKSNPDKIVEESQESLVKNTESPKLGAFKLTYTPNTGFAHYNGAECIFTGKKSRALLNVLNENKGVSYSVDEIKQKCNLLIPNSNIHFKGDKDIYDTVLGLRKKLKVNIGEYFPIQKLEEKWIWVQK